MQRYQNRFCAAAAFAAVAGFGIAQAPAVSPGSTPPSLPVNLGTLHGIAQADGRVVGFSMRYKAVFDHGGVEYTPALGERAPHNMPLRFTLQSVRRGEQTLLDATAAAPPAWSLSAWLTTSTSRSRRPPAASDGSTMSSPVSKPDGKRGPASNSSR